MPQETLSIQVRSVEEMLHAESPVISSRLHPDVSEALWNAIRQVNPRAGFRFEIIVPAPDLSREGDVREAVQKHFHSEVAAFSEGIREIVWNGWASARIGGSLALFLLLISEGLLLLNERMLPEFLSRGLVIVAWVALWRPAELLVYEHLPLRKQRMLARKAAEAHVVLRPAESLCRKQSV
ncbi:MAG: hypothetical protein NTV93_18300 [Verrucomicrobia bacterium]|jgi:hypothetical protein|nr:hypothetical protein [Verrucomicrobiota bacterium]